MKKITILIMAFLLFFIFSGFVSGAISQDERDALIALYNSTDGANWTNNTNWLGAPGTEDTWFGITVTSDQVRTIDLNSNKLVGTIPTDLDKLINLTYLRLSNNQLNGEIPASIGTLSNLEYLTLSYNQLTGNIPPALGFLSSLRSLGLENNQLDGDIPTSLGALGSLTYLSLNSNQLTGTIPSTLGGLLNLTSLSLHVNQLSGDIPSQLGLLGNLRSLYLNSNQLTGNIPTSFGGLTSLRYLDISYNQLNGSIPAALGGLSELQSIRLWGNQLSGNIPPELGNLGNLTTLYLQRNHLDGSIPSELKDLSQIQSMYLSYNNLTGEIPTDLSSLTTLTTLDIQYNGFFTNNAGLKTFLDSKQVGGDWESTQTIAPKDVTGTGISPSAIRISWTPIAYTANTGGYLIFISTTSGVFDFNNPYGTTADKTVSEMDVTGLNPGTDYYFVLKTQTDAFPLNQNTILSGPSAEGTATTQQTMTLPTVATASISNITPSSADCGGNVTSDGSAAVTARGVCWSTSQNPEVTDNHTLNGAGTGSFSSSITGLAPNTLYYVRAFATNIMGTAYGNEVSFTTTFAGLPAEQRAALIAFYNSTNGDNWTYNSGWKNPPVDPIDGFSLPGTEDTWYGITIANGQVESISYYYNNLVGPIPAAIKDLPNLQTLRLPFNQVSGNLPTTLGLLTNLTSIDLSYNELTGKIPSELGALINLESLNLNFNQLDQEIPTELGTMASLKSLNINHNYLTGSIPTSLGAIANLETLDLRGNSLENEIPDAVINHSQLTSLNLSSNQLTGSIPSNLNGNSKLTDLILANNQLTGNIPPQLNQFSELLILDLSQNQLTGNIPSELKDLSKLTYLDLAYNELDGDIPIDLKDLSKLTHLSLSFNKLTGNIPSELKDLTELTFLDLSYNYLEGVIPIDLGTIISLEELNLSDNKLEGNIPLELGNLANLQSLSVSANKLAGSVPVELKNLTSLTDNYSDFGYNCLFTDDATLKTFLDLKQSWGDWDDTQTIAPVNVTATENGPGTIRVSWDPIKYTDDLGGYMVFCSTASGVYDENNPFGITPDKTVSFMDVTNLNPETEYFFVVKTKSIHFGHNQHTLISEYSNEDSATTTTGFTTPTVTTADITNILSDSAYCGGNITSNGGTAITARGVCWGTSINPEAIGINKTNDGTGTGSFTSHITGLSPNTTYHVRAYASNAAGTSYGSNKSFTTIAAGGIPSNQRQALIKLYESTDGDNWFQNSGWTSDPLPGEKFSRPGTENTWFGVTISDDQVTQINLENNKLNGPLPNELMNLSNLTHLNLSWNKLQGGIPNVLGFLTKLTQLRLQGNQLTGPIPTSFSFLSELTQLWLENNHLSGTISPNLKFLTKLYSLNLSYNKLTGTIPKELGQLSELILLSLSGNKLTGSIPGELGNLSKLRKIYLNSNQLEGSIPSNFGSLSNLRRLYLYSNKLTGEIPTNITSLTSLYNEGSDLTYNALFTDNPSVKSFLDSKQIEGDWESTQTIAPINVSVAAVSDTSIRVNWDPVDYTENPGAYLVYCSSTSGSYDYANPAAITTDKSITEIDITGLTPGEQCYFVVRTRTDAHVTNQNAVDSSDSQEQSASTYADPFSLTITITNPVHLSSVTGATIINADVSLVGTGTVDRVEFYINGELVKEDNNAPYQHQWDTTKVKNGDYNILGKVFHSSGISQQHEIRVFVTNLGGDPHIELNRDQLNFVAFYDEPVVTGAQSVFIGNSGACCLNWTAAASDPWITVTPLNGTANMWTNISVDPTGLANGTTYEGSVTITDPNADNSPMLITVHLEVKDDTNGLPIEGSVDSPLDGSTVYGSVPVTGWAIDDSEITSVKIYRSPVAPETDDVLIGEASFVEGMRTDIEALYPDYPKNYKAGWGYMMLTNGFPNGGNGSFTITVIATDSFNNEKVLGTKTINCDNASSAKPFGNIDAPAPGETVSGKSYNNFGWALTPLPNTIPSTGSYIHVWVDGMLVAGDFNYGMERTDVEALFPGYNNSSAPGGAFLLDTTLFGNGLHTIAWSVKDDANNIEGIGSRYFSIQNVSGATSSNTSEVENDINQQSGTQAMYIGTSTLQEAQISLSPVIVKKGYDRNARGQAYAPDESGIFTIEIKEDSRLEIELKPDSDDNSAIYGHRIVRDRLRLLPIGSSLDHNKGIFYWKPCAGFLGLHRFVFFEKNSDNKITKKYIDVVIRTKH